MLKAILCNVTKKPFAIVDVSPDVKSIKFAGAYTASGDAVNVSVNKLTASKRVMKKRSVQCLLYASLHEKSGTYYIDANQKPVPYIFLTAD